MASTTETGAAATNTIPSVALLGGASYMAGPIAEHLKKNSSTATGYRIVALVRPTTNTDAANVREYADVVCKGDLSDKTFLLNSLKNENCIAILNFLCQLMPPKDNIKEQMENDLPPLMAALETAYELNSNHGGCIFVHTSGNFSLPSAGKVGGVFKNELPAAPEEPPPLYDEESWSTFAHEGGMESVSMLAEAKHRQDHAVEQFCRLHSNNNFNACTIIPAGIYGPAYGTKFSFWDMAANLYLQGQFADFAHAFLHVQDLAKIYQAVIEQQEKWTNTAASTHCRRIAACGESMTVREFVRQYVKALPSMDLPANFDSLSQCSDEESKRVYDDSETLAMFGDDVRYQHTLETSLPDAIERLRSKGLLMVGSSTSDDENK